MTALAIGQAQRDALWGVIRRRLGDTLCDVLALYEGGDGGAAQDLHYSRSAPALRLLDDIGWEEQDARERFTLTLPSWELRRFLSDEADDLERVLRDWAAGLGAISPDETDRRGRNTQAAFRTRIDKDLERLHVCGELLAVVGQDG
jgi:hypothetical protein